MLLSAVDVKSQWSWRWLLTDPKSGKALAAHAVRLDPADADTAAFRDVYRWVRWNADPQRRLASETVLVARVGQFVRDHALGAAVVDGITSGAPASVRVDLSDGAEWLAFLPWELAHDDAGQPLAARGDVTLVYDLRAQPQAAKLPVKGALRMLAVFSLPTSQSLLGLRRERYALSQLVQRIQARTGRRIELTVAQYGATRERLAKLAGDGDGWDVLHLSGHGGAGQFLLEKPDGTPDPVTTEKLVALLDPARRRVKLVVASACESGAATTAETLRWLGLAEQAEPLEAQADQETEAAAAAQSGLARAVVERFGCCVVAMRHPVIDDFAISLAGAFYDRLWDSRQPVDRAFTEAVTQAAGRTPTHEAPALSVGTPALFGASAIGLALTPPKEKVSLDPEDSPMSGFLPEPVRFVGRGPALAAASRVLAPEWSGPGSRPVAVFFHGMAGAGKTACALEIAYRHQDAFTAHAFWAAPTDPAQFGDALRLIALALERQLPGFTMVDKIGNSQNYQAFLPRLKTLLRDHGILLVLDNLETLLTEDGSWRDPRWEPLIATLTGHGGQTRTILTSRVVPTGLDFGHVRLEAVHALSRDETLLLARELPNLRILLESAPEAGFSGPLRVDEETSDTSGDTDAGEKGDGTGEPVMAGRELALATLELVQGHPKMLELADAAAGTDPAALAAAVATARSALPGARLQAFLTTGTTILDGEQLFTALAAWTSSAVTRLPEASRLLLQVLCQMEEPDRDSVILEGNWAEIWRRLQLPGEPPPTAETLHPLLRSALVGAEPLDPSTSDADEGLGRYRIHPGIAQTVQAATPPETSDAVDTQLAAWFTGFVQHANEQVEAGHNTTRVVHFAGLHAAPYLLRLHDWDNACTVLNRARMADPRNPLTLQAVIPPLEQIAAETGDAQHIGVLAAALEEIDRERAGTLLRQLYTRAVENGDHRTAVNAAAELIELYPRMGRADDALTLVDELIRHIRHAGLGPWTQISAQGLRFRVLGYLGQYRYVLEQLPEVLKAMEKLPDRARADEAVAISRVRPFLLSIGRDSAVALRRWQEALDYNEEDVASLRRRGASTHELADSRINSVGPLIELGRYDEAQVVLRDCRQTYEDVGDIGGLAKVFTALAALESIMEHRGDAVRLQRQALRLEYVYPRPLDIAIAHLNLARYLSIAAGDPAEQRGHVLAAALLFTLVGDTHHARGTLDILARELRDAAASDGITEMTVSWMPTTVDEVGALVEATEGVRYTSLVTALTEPASADETLTQVLHTASQLGVDQEPDGGSIEKLLAVWQPIIQAVTVAAAGFGPVPREQTELLDQLATTQDWNQLVTRIGRVLAGDRNRDALLNGLDPVDTAILTAILDRLSA
jgi:tetratricopeptide (TPR) repeat protein